MHTSFLDSVMRETAILVRRIRHRVTGVLTLILPFFVVFYLQSCSKLSEYDEQRIRSVLADTLLNATESWKINMRLMDQKKRVVQIKAPYAKAIGTETDSYTLFHGPVQVMLFDEEQQVMTDLVCASAKYFTKTSNFEFFGDVDVSTKDSLSLRTEYLRWDKETKRIFSDQFVIIVTPKDSIAGYGVTGKDDFSEYVITRVSGKVTID